MRYIFKKGDVVKLIPYEDDKNKCKAIKSENKYNAIANFSPYNCHICSLSFMRFCGIM